MTGVFFLNGTAVIIAKVACCGAGIAALAYIGYRAVLDYKERFSDEL